MKIQLLVFSLIFIFTTEAQSAKKLLYKAYNKRSSELLDTFFENWQAEIQPITDSEFQSLNDTIRNVYEVYTEFLKWKTEDSTHHKYALVQNSIQINFSRKVSFSALEIDSIISVSILADSSLGQTLKVRYLKKTNGSFSNLVKELYWSDKNAFPKPIFSKTEINFRPVLINVLYLNQKYSSLLDEFLNVESNPDRKLFLDNYLKIQKDHFVGKWEFIPYTQSIVTFDEKMEYVRIHYGVGEMVKMKRENGKWKFISHELLFLR